MPTSTIDHVSVRALLLARRRELLGRYRTQLALAEEELTPEIEETETATEQWDATVLTSLADHERRTIEQVTAALARLDAGSYGTCPICRSPVGDDRLEALPEALTCFECAEAREPFTA